MRPFVELSRCQFLILLRSPMYWVMSVVLTGLWILYFGVLAAGEPPATVGVVGQATNLVTRAWVSALRDRAVGDVVQGSQRSELEELSRGRRLAVIVVPQDARGPADAELWTYPEPSYQSTAAIGLIREAGALLGASAESRSAVTARPVSAVRTLLEIVLPGLLGMAILFGSRSGATTIAWLRHNGALRRIALAGVSPRSMFAAQCLVFGVLSLLQIALLVVFAVAAFGVVVYGSLLALGLVVAAGTFAFLAIWFAIAAGFRSIVAITNVSYLVSLVSIFAAGSLLPTREASSFLVPVLAVIPLKPLNEALRAVVTHGAGVADVGLSVGILLVWGGAALVLGQRVFKWSSH